MKRLEFEREFLKLAGTAFACTLEIMGGEIPGRNLYGRDYGVFVPRVGRSLRRNALTLPGGHGKTPVRCRLASSRTAYGRKTDTWIPSSLTTAYTHANVA